MTETRTSNVARFTIAGLVAAAFVVFAVGATLWALGTDFGKKGAGTQSGAGESSALVASGEGTQVFGAPEQAGPVAMEVANVPPAPAIRLTVYEASLLRNTLKANVWLKRVLTEPLGRGFVGSWAGFLGTRGEDMSGDFTGPVVDLLLDKVLAQPFEVVWFAGKKAAGAPAIVIQEPNGAAKAAFETLDAVAGRGTFILERCIEEGALSEEAEKRVRYLNNVTIKRWLLADHALYASLEGDRLVLGRRPTVVAHGICSALPSVEPEPQTAISVTFEPEALGRDAQVFLASLGLESTRLLLGVENGTLVPRGIAATVQSPGRLVSGRLGGELLKAIPEEAPVVLAMQVALPKALDADALAAFFKGTHKGPTAPRQVAIVWYPAGRQQSGPDIAILWSEKSDKAALETIFESGLRVADKPICNNLALAATPEVREKLESSCSGKIPSLNHGTGSVVAGWQGNSSVVLGINFGKLLTGLTRDAWNQENGNATMPPEMQEATRELDALPFFGLSGALQGNKLVPGGFRS